MKCELSVVCAKGVQCMTDQVTLPSDKSTGTAGAGTQRQYCQWVPKWCLVKQHWTGTRDGLQTTKIPKVVLGRAPER